MFDFFLVLYGQWVSSFYAAKSFFDLLHSYFGISINEIWCCFCGGNLSHKFQNSFHCWWSEIVLAKWVHLMMHWTLKLTLKKWHDFKFKRLSSTETNSQNIFGIRIGKRSKQHELIDLTTTKKESLKTLWMYIVQNPKPNPNYLTWNNQFVITISMELHVTTKYSIYGQSYQISNFFSPNVQITMPTQIFNQQFAIGRPKFRWDMSNISTEKKYYQLIEINLHRKLKMNHFALLFVEVMHLEVTWSANFTKFTFVIRRIMFHLIGYWQHVRTSTFIPKTFFL